MSKGIDRRQLIAGAPVLGATAMMAGSAAAAPQASAPSASRQPSRAYAHRDGPRSRVIVVNDLSGDIDGLFSTVHAVLSTSTETSAIIGTRTFTRGETAAVSVELAQQILTLMGRTDIPVFAGGETPMTDVHTPVDSPAARAIVAEAMREDTKLPLYVCVGGGLTEIASALLLEPRISQRLTLVWIGGGPHPAGGQENNLMIDPAAAQFIFNETDVPMWQVTSDAYRLCMVSDTELQAHVAPHGRIGAWLYESLFPMAERIKSFLPEGSTWNTGETWTMGDSPLVLLTALTAWVPLNVMDGLRSGAMRYEGTGGSLYDDLPAPRMDADGNYTTRADGRTIRVYRTLDTRMMLGDFFAKMKMNYPA